MALLSSGDPGIYGMAGLAVEIRRAEGFDVAVEIVPGVTAASAAAAALGALMLDFAAISLSDLFVPWETIRHQLSHSRPGRPGGRLTIRESAKRVRQLEEAVAILLPRDRQRHPWESSPTRARRSSRS